MSKAQAHNPATQLIEAQKSGGEVVVEGYATTPMEMLGQAVASGQSVEVLEKLMSLQERWEANQARKSFDKAMAELRDNMPTIMKGSTVDFYHKGKRTYYKYEDLDAVTSALSPVMSPLGLSFRWSTNQTNNGVSVTCIVSHREGHVERTTLMAPPDNSAGKSSIQAIGSTVTYLQRYTLKAAVGIAAAHDDDGRGAGQEARNEPQRLSKANSRDLYKELQGDIDAADSKDALEVWIKERKADIDKLPEDHLQYLRERYAEKMNDFITKNEGLDYDQYGQYQ